MPQRRLLINIVGILSLSLSLACGSASLPPKLSPAERQEILAIETLEAQEPWQEIVIGVERFHRPVYSDNLIVALRDTGLFARVEPLESLETTPPDLVAVVHMPPRGRAVIPLFTFLSLGFVPTIVDETEGYRFDLLAPAQATGSAAGMQGDSNERLAIEYIQESKVVIGWLGLALSPSPRWTMKDTRRHPRTIDRLRMHLLRHRTSIQALLDE